MNTSVDIQDTVAVNVRIEENKFYIILEDGRELGVPYNWFWRLEKANPEQRNNWRLIGGGHGIHWKDIDEDISVLGILKGIRSSS
ncbi:MAG: DUF2442 domain-containing protein [Lewinella sp.]|nr:DUF2442 domain-containing protein [Lewinella sp.]